MKMPAQRERGQGCPRYSRLGSRRYSRGNLQGRSFSSAPLPFAKQLGPGALHMSIGFALFLYCVLGDFFQLVRLKAFVDFWHTFRGQPESEL